MSEVKKNPSAVLKCSPGEPVTLVPADVFECAMERLDDRELLEIIRSRRHEKPISVNLDDL
ncbi:antitoxin [Pseudomonas sp. MDT2-39-1]|uniref:antitoxin n=1 Tax=Pseudomonas sp. BGI-2 TaxID=2528211 RepID=UPI001033763E|nr:antitoxin [Pseudomonas sp. BGI-2]TBN46687.1 antitoxin [Pseudomonas sp. BGI-2]